MDNRKHYFGARVNGTLGLFSNGAVLDAEFEHATKDGLPSGWVAWHLEPGETSQNSERVQAIRRLPILVELAGELSLLHHDGSGCVRSPHPIVSWQEWMTKANVESAAV
jgi:hypothetical protein